MSNSLRLMTFNVQCRSFVGEAGGQVNVLPLYNPEERARAISKRILASSHDFDVVALNEVFDEGARGVFAEYLGQRYPHAVLKPGKDISLLVGGVATLLSGNPLFLALGVLASDFTFDDSGVMLFSKFPFAKRAISTATGTQTTEATAFIPYSETAETDSLAAKGALYVEVVGPGGRPVHLIATHTQADYENPGQNADIRKKQLTQAWNHGVKLSRLSLFTGAEGFIVGDLNIIGGSAEWSTLFDTLPPPTQLNVFTDFLRDAWYHEQVPGQPNALSRAPTDPGFTAPAEHGRPPQRLDYIVRNRNAAMPDRLVTQHIAVCWDLCAGGGYLSDHAGLRIDLNIARKGRHSVNQAEPVQVSLESPQAQVHGALSDGQMDWFVIDQAGAYDFKLTSTDARCAFDVYERGNLSVPLGSYGRTVDDRYGVRYVIPTAPFFLRVFTKKRRVESAYSLQIHRRTGASRGEAINLPPSPSLKQLHKTYGATKQGNVLNSNDPATPWDDADCVWYDLHFAASDSGEHQNAVVELTDGTGLPFTSADFGLLLVSGDGATLAASIPPAAGIVRLQFEVRHPGRYFLLVKRSNPTVGHEFHLVWTTDLSVAYCMVGNRGNGGVAMILRCEKTTQGLLDTRLGSDEINVNLYADGKHVRHAPYTQMGGFVEGRPVQLARWIKPVYYVRELRVELVELDDLSRKDIGATILPPLIDHYHPAGWTEFISSTDGVVGGALKVELAGGRYAFEMTLGKWIPSGS